MATKGLVAHIITVNNIKYAVHLPDEYGGAGGLGSVLGITKTDDNDPASQPTPGAGGKMSSLKESGLVIEIQVSGKDTSNAAGKLKYFKVPCAANLVASAIGGLPGKTLTAPNSSKTYKIHHAGFKANRRLG